MEVSSAKTFFFDSLKASQATLTRWCMLFVSTESNLQGNNSVPPDLGSKISSDDIESKWDGKGTDMESSARFMDMLNGMGETLKVYGADVAVLFQGAKSTYLNNL